MDAILFGTNWMCDSKLKKKKTVQTSKKNWMCDSKLKKKNYEQAKKTVLGFRLFFILLQISLT
jgi:hypothetical protein